MYILFQLIFNKNTMFKICSMHFFLIFANILSCRRNITKNFWNTTLTARQHYTPLKHLTTSMAPSPQTHFIYTKNSLYPRSSPRTQSSSRTNFTPHKAVPGQKSRTCWHHLGERSCSSPMRRARDSAAD